MMAGVMAGVTVDSMVGTKGPRTAAQMAPMLVEQLVQSTGGPMAGMKVEW